MAEILIDQLAGQSTHSRIRGVGRPIDILNRGGRGNVQLPAGVVPDVWEAVEEYPGNVLLESEVEGDVLSGHPELIEQRWAMMVEEFDLDAIAYELPTSCHPRFCDLFADFILYFIHVTELLDAQN